MVAEPVAESGQPEVAEEEVPNPVVESGAEQEPEPEDDFSDVLEVLNKQPTEGEGSKPASQGKTEQKPQLTEEQIRAEERARVQREQEQTAKTTLRARQIEGMRESWKAYNSDLESALAVLGDPNQPWDAVEAAKTKIRNRSQQHNGVWNELYQNDVPAAHEAGKQFIVQNVVTGAAAHIGEDSLQEVLGAGHASWEDWLNDYGERYAKKKGYLTKAEADSRFSDGQKDTLKKLKNMGIALPRGGEARNLGTPRGNGRHFRTAHENNEAFNSGEITPEVWKANDDAFKKAAGG